MSKSKQLYNTRIQKGGAILADMRMLVRSWEEISVSDTTSEASFPALSQTPHILALQSPKRKLTVWVFQERFTTDRLFKVRSEFSDPRARWLEARIKELKEKAEVSVGGEKRRTEKEASQLADILDDIQEFSKRINTIIRKGYTPHIDDGVLINAAPCGNSCLPGPTRKRCGKNWKMENTTGRTRPWATGRTASEKNAKPINLLPSPTGWNERSDMDLIKHVSIEGFKSIKNLDRLELGAINVMIGPNGSGKSNFIDLFQLLNYAMTESLQNYVKTRGFAESFLYLGSKTTSRIRGELEFGTEIGTNRYRFTLVAAVGDILIFSEESIFF